MSSALAEDMLTLSFMAVLYRPKVIISDDNIGDSIGENLILFCF